MYLSDDSGLGAARKWAHRRRPASNSEHAPSRMSGLGAFGAPVFNVERPDPPGCAPVDAAGCRAAIGRGATEALDRALTQMGVGGGAREAITSGVRAAIEQIRIR